MFNIVQVIFPGCQLVNYSAIELASCQVNDGWGRKLKKSSFFVIAFLKHIFKLKRQAVPAAIPPAIPQNVLFYVRRAKLGLLASLLLTNGNSGKNLHQKSRWWS